MRRKKALIILILIIMLFTVIIPSGISYAAGDSVEDEGSIGERMITAPTDGLIVVIQKLEELGGLKTLDQVIFNKDGAGDRAPFSNDEWNKIMTWFSLLAISTAALIIIAIYVQIFKTITVAYNPAAKVELANAVGRWVFVFVLIAAIPYIFTVLSGINNALIDTLIAIAQKVSSSAAVQNLTDASGKGTLLNNLHTGSIFGTSIAKLALLGVEVFINILFKIRKNMLLVMMIFSSVAAYIWAINGQKNALTIVLGEIFSNIFMQSAYALVFLIFITFINMKTVMWIDVIIWMYFITGVAEVIRNVFQSLMARWSGVDESGIAGKAMRFAGLGGLVGMSQVFNGKKGISEALDGIKNKSGGDGGAAGGGYGGTPAGGLMKTTAGSVKAGGYAGKIGGVIGGLAGGVGGAALGMALPGGDRLAKPAAKVIGNVAGGMTGGIARGVTTAAGIGKNIYDNWKGYEGLNPVDATKLTLNNNSLKSSAYTAARIVAQNTINPSKTPELLQGFGLDGTRYR